MTEEKIAYISNEVLPRLKKNWKNVKNIKFEPEVKKGHPHFQSIAIFGDIVIEFDSGESENSKKQKDNKNSETQMDELVGHLGRIEVNKESKRISVLIKMQIIDEIAMGWTNGGLNFFNEIFFYNEILPYFDSKLKIQDIFPEIIHGHFSDTKRDEDIVILKNLNSENFWSTSSKTVQSLEHLLVALRKIGRFHACSYIMKTIDEQGFMQKVKSLKLVKAWLVDPDNIAYTHFQKTSKRPASYLDKFPDYKDKLLKSGFSNFFENLPNLLPKIYDANNKLNVLCHGDFNRHNMLFKYETGDESNLEPNADAKVNPIDVKFFDLADIIYATPVVDLSFLLFMNTSQEMRQSHWEAMLQTYHQAIRTECEKFPNVWFPSFEDICDEFKTNCMIGFMICSFFLPMMLEEKIKDRSEWSEKPTNEDVKKVLRGGGDVATKAVGELLMFILDKDFI